MKLNNKGFTLLELSAIMVVLAVLLLIAYGGIRKIVISSQKGAFKVTAESIAKSADNNFAIDSEADEYYFIDGDQYSSGRDLKFKGETPKNGVVSVSSTGNTALAIHNGEYCATISGDGEEAVVTEKPVAECVTYNIVETKKPWQEIANDNNTSIVDLLDLNNEPDQNSETTNKDIKIPVRIVPDLETLVLLEQTEAYQTYYTIAKTTYNASLNNMTYSYTINLGMLPMPLAKIKSAEVISSNVMSGIEDFKQYIVRKLMGAVVWPAGEEVTLSIDQAQGFKDHSVTSANMDVDNVVVTCNETKCSATITETIHNLTGVIPNVTEVYLPVKFTVKFSDSALVATSCNTYKTYNSDISNLIAQGYIPIASASDLNQIRQQNVSLTFGAGTLYAGTYVSGLDKKYIQVSDVDLTAYSSGLGWIPLGVDRALPDGGGVDTYFTGIYNGGCFSITNLTINRPNSKELGLFGATSLGATISNIVIENANITGGSSTGTLIGYAENAKVENIYINTNLNPYNSDSVNAYSSYGYAMGGVIGYGWVTTIQHAYVTMIASNSYGTGGIAGEVGENTKIVDSHTNVNITGNGTTAYNAGGIVGWQYDSSVIDCSSVGTISAVRQIGGLVGGNEHATIINSYADVDVSGYDDSGVGGLVGESYENSNNSSIISNSYSTGDVTGVGRYTGGLIGFHEGYIVNSYSHSNVYGASEANGGFVGYNEGIISNSYSTGTVEAGTVSTGGFAGTNIATINDSYFYQNPNNGFANKKTDSEMKLIDTYVDWDLDDIWNISSENYPTLKQQNSVMSDGILFDKSTNAIYGTMSPNKNISIPSSYLIAGKSIPVYVIGGNAFKEQGIESVTLAEGLTTIGDYAFADNLLTNLTLPSTMITIGYYSFADNQIISLSIPSSVNTIDDHAFRDNELVSVTFSEGLNSIGYASFDSNKISSLNIPNSVTTIDGFAFANNSLTSTTIANGITSIGRGAFQYNNMLQNSFTIDRAPGTVTLGNYVLNNNGATKTTTITPRYLR